MWTPKYRTWYWPSDLFILDYGFEEESPFRKGGDWFFVNSKIKTLEVMLFWQNHSWDYYSRYQRGFFQRGRRGNYDD